MTKEIVIFDWDGTLMDSEAHIVACLAETLAELGEAAQPPEQLKQVIGLGLEQAFARLLPHLGAARIHQLSQQYREIFLQRGPSPSALFPSAREVLEQLRSDGYYLAIATGKSRRGLDKVLAETGLESLFAITRCADETRSKPHPQMLEEILVDLNSEPGKAIMIGDTEFDLQMAANVKMDSVGVSYGVHAVECLREHAPVAIIDSLSELPAVLQRLPAN